MSGTPSTAGAFSYAIKVTDSGSPTPQTATTTTVSGTIAPATLTITPTASGTTQVGKSYSQSNAASGGTTPYSFTLASGALPVGTTLSSTTGTVSGTPSTAGAFSYAIKVTDSGSPTPQTATTTTVSGTIAPATLTITPTASGTTQVGKSYSQSNAASGGTTPYSFTLASGALPVGTTLSSTTGTVSGTPSTAGAFSYAVKVTDSGSPTPQTATTTAVSGTIAPPATLTITPATAVSASGIKGGPFAPSSFQYQLSASSGTINYSISGLPAWLTASSISGTLTTSPTTVTFTVNASANSLNAGTYGPSAITFTNVTNGQGTQTQTATLTVNSNGKNSRSKTYVSARTGSDTGPCSVTAPCATLNYALSVTGVGGQVTVLDGGLFGPIVITQSVTIDGYKSGSMQIMADPSAQVGCIGALPSACGLTNNGYAVEIAAGVNDSVKISHVFMAAGSSGGAGALMFTSGGTVQLSGNVYRGNDTATGPIVALYPNNPGTSEAQVDFSNSDVGFSNGGAVLVAPSGSNNFNFKFDHMEVHNAAFGVTEDATGLTSGNKSRMVISESKFFSFSGSAVTVLTSPMPGTGGEADSALRRINIFNAGGAAINADGAQSQLVLSNSTITGNNIGLKSSNGAAIATSASNTIQGNGTNVSGPQPPSEVTGSVNLGPPAP